MEPRHGTVPTLLLERLALGEPTPQAGSVWDRGLAPASLLAQQLEQIEASNRVTLQAYPPRRVAAEVRRRHRAQQERTRRAACARAWPLAPLLAAAGVALLLWPSPAPPDAAVPAHPGEQTRAKGGRPHLALYLRPGTARGEPAERLARAGDLVQIGYVAAGARYGVVLSVDGRGAVTLHLPERPGAAPRLRAEGESLLPFSYELDDAPGFERFFLVTAAHAFEVEQVLAAARALARVPGSAEAAPLALPAGFAQHSITLHKVDP